jgi:DNA-directed RNA polymerase subunit RPC12/RpoP
MAHKGEYHCNECGNVFLTEHGDLTLSRRLRCVACDKNVWVKWKEYPLPLPQLYEYSRRPSSEFSHISQEERDACIAAWTKQDLEEYERTKEHNRNCRTDWSCPDCGAELRGDLLPMCPVCRFRDVKRGAIFVWED